MDNHNSAKELLGNDSFSTLDFNLAEQSIPLLWLHPIFKYTVLLKPKFSCSLLSRLLNSTSALDSSSPYTETEIQAAIICSKKHNVQIRLGSGGHLSRLSIIIIDLTNCRSISVDLEDETAWFSPVQRSGLKFSLKLFWIIELEL